MFGGPFANTFAYGLGSGRPARPASDIRDAAVGRGRFGDFPNSDFAVSAHIFAQSGYSRIEIMREMQGEARSFFVTSRRRNVPGKREHAKCGDPRTGTIGDASYGNGKFYGSAD